MDAKGTPASVRSDDSEVSATVAAVVNKGIRLCLEGGQLRASASRGALDANEVRRLRDVKAGAISLLEPLARAGSDTHVVPRLCIVPVTYSQLARWNLHGLGKRKGVRQIASAIKLVGPLNLHYLQSSFREVVLRHEALRSRIIDLNGTLFQAVSAWPRYEFTVADLSDRPEMTRESDIGAEIEQFILRHINISEEPLLGARLLRFHDQEHVLIVAMEHMISDMFSLGIVERDLFIAYRQISAGQAIALPVVETQFSEYALQQKESESAWRREHDGYWHERLRGGWRLKFTPESTGLGPRSGWAVASIRLGPDKVGEIKEWSRNRKCTVVLAALTAYVALVLRWCRLAEAIIQYHTDGRTTRAVENTVGFFATSLYLRMTLKEDDDFTDLVERVMCEYRNAFEHVDCSRIASQTPRPEFTRNPGFNWVPRGGASELLNGLATESSLVCEHIPFSHPVVRTLELDHEPYLYLVESAEGVEGGLHYPSSRFHEKDMERFAVNYHRFLELMLRSPERQIMTIELT